MQCRENHTAMDGMSHAVSIPFGSTAAAPVGANRVRKWHAWQCRRYPLSWPAQHNTHLATFLIKQIAGQFLRSRWQRKNIDFAYDFV